MRAEVQQRYDPYQILEMMRGRPAMYLGKKSLPLINAFLCGCSFIALEEKVSPDFSRFHDWVATKLNWFESTAGWCNMIVQECKWDEAQAVDLFYVLLDEFRNTNGKMPKRPSGPKKSYMEKPE